MGRHSFLDEGAEAAEDADDAKDSNEADGGDGDAGDAEGQYGEHHHQLLGRHRLFTNRHLGNFVLARLE